MENYGYQSAMRKYFQFSGRGPRREYWMFTLIYFIIYVIASVLDGFIFGFNFQSTENSFSAVSEGPISLVVMLGHLIPGFSVTARRLHDTGRSAWWILIVLVPLIGILVLLYFMVKSSDPDANEHGSNPYLMSNADVF